MAGTSLEKSGAGLAHGLVQLLLLLFLLICIFDPTGILALSILIANLAMFRKQSPVPRGVT